MADTKEWILKSKIILKGEKKVAFKFDGGYIAIVDEMNFERDGKNEHIDPSVRVYGVDIPKKGAALTHDAVLTIVQMYQENSQFRDFVDNLFN